MSDEYDDFMEDAVERIHRHNDEDVTPAQAIILARGEASKRGLSPAPNVMPWNLPKSGERPQ